MTIVGRLQFKVEVQHKCTVSLRLKEIKFDLQSNSGKNHYIKMKVQVPESTIDCVTNKNTMNSVYEGKGDKIMIDLGTNNDLFSSGNYPMIDFEITHRLLRTSCIRIFLWTLSEQVVQIIPECNPDCNDEEQLSRLKKLAYAENCNNDILEAELCIAFEKLMQPIIKTLDLRDRIFFANRFVIYYC